MCFAIYPFSPIQVFLLQKLLVPPEILIFVSAILGTFLIIAIVAIRFGKVMNRKLSTLIFIANKVERQELDFEISTSGIKEVDVILRSLDQMRVAVKDALESQWKTEQKNRQISALAHDLKTPSLLCAEMRNFFLNLNFQRNKGNIPDTLKAAPCKCRIMCIH